MKTSGRNYNKNLNRNKMNREAYKRKLEESKTNEQTSQKSIPKKSVSRVGAECSTDKGTAVRMSKDAERTIIGQNQELIGKVQETREELECG